MALSRIILLIFLILPILVSTSPRRSLPTWMPEAPRGTGRNLLPDALRDQQRDDQVTSILEDLMMCRDVSGLSVSVVRGETVILEEGMGVTSLLTGQQVDPYSSQFCVGELTMAFTSTLLGILLNENRHQFRAGWDTLVRDIMGADFTLADELRTSQATVRDLLAHRLGIPSYDKAWLFGLDPQHTRQDYCRRLSLLDTGRARTFRASFESNKFMYLMAACVAEKLGGLPYEELLEAKLLRPLGMHRTMLISQMQDLDGVASSYVYNDTIDNNVELDPSILRTVSMADAAAGICTTAADMTRWMQFHLNKGRLGNMPSLIPEHLWRGTHDVNMILSGSERVIAKPRYPVTDLTAGYGLGWTVGNYRGFRYSRHSGSLAGFESLITIYHDIDLAVYTSINGPKFESQANDVMHYIIADVVMGARPWLSDVTMCRFPEVGQSAHSIESTAGDRFRQRARLAADMQTKRRRQPRLRKLRKPRGVQEEDGPNEWFAAYEGVYGHLLFGNITVFYDNFQSQLRIEMGIVGSGWLQRLTDQFWMVHFDGVLEYFSSIGPNKGIYPPIRFVGSSNNQYSTLIFQGLRSNSRAAPSFTRGAVWDTWTDYEEVEIAPPRDRFLDLFDC